MEIDFFRDLTTGEGTEREKAINQRYQELLSEEGDRILLEVIEARKPSSLRIWSNWRKTR